MLLRRMTKHVKDQNWFAVALDFVIVVVGVFIGIQLGNLNDNRTNVQNEGRLTERLVNDLNGMRNIYLRDDAIVRRIHDGWVHAFRALEACQASGEHSAAIDYAFSQYQRSFSPPIQRAAFDEMQSTGAFSRLNDRALKNDLTSLYSSLDSELSVAMSGRNNHLAAGRIMWKYIAFSFVEDTAISADLDSWGTADFNPLDHCENLELRGAVWEIVDTNRDQLRATADYVGRIDRILAHMQENGVQ